MARHRASLGVACPRCGAAAERVFSAGPPASKLHFASSLTCSSCGHTEEADGATLTDEARQAFYASEGRWSLVIRDLGANRLEALRVLRSYRELPPADLARMVAGGEPFAEGTLAEIEQIETALGAAGITVAKSRAADGAG